MEQDITNPLLDLPQIPSAKSTMAPISSPSTPQHPLSNSQTSSSSTSNPIPSAARIRANQRRSRARRKEYVLSLEHKLRKCEQAGVKASVDIQLAARGVAEENKRLRVENGRLREDGEELRGEIGLLKEENERLGGMLDGDGEGKEEEGCGCGGAEVGGEGVGEGVPGGIEYAQSGSGSTSQPKDNLDLLVGETTATTSSKGERITQPSPALPESLQTVSYSSQEDEMVLADDTSSCEYAAHIITSMRADISTDDVRADLGCDGAIDKWGTCKVDNLRLFGAVDRYAA